MARIDLDEVDAALAEERLEGYEIVFCGETFTIPNARLWDERVSDAIEGNHLSRVFGLIMGEAELERLREAGKRSRVGRLTLDHLAEIMAGITEAQGLGEPGGIPGWRAYAREHWRTLEPDFQRFYSLNLAACLAGQDTPRISPRRLARLIEALPLESATVQATLTPDQRARARWGFRDETALATLNLLIRWRHEWLTLHIDPKERYRLRAPDLIRRPWETVDEPAAPSFSTKDDVRAFFGQAIRYTPKPQPD